MKYFYAVQGTRDDSWDCGSYDRLKAEEMLIEQGHGLIAVIEDPEDNPFCVEEISYEEVQKDEEERSC